MTKLRAPCSYQGGKQRVAQEIVDHLLEAALDQHTYFYDLCCGSGAIAVELVNRGIDPKRIVMLDGSSWGAFWLAIGTGSFKRQEFEELLGRIPADKRQVKSHVETLAAQTPIDNEAEIYPLLQACSFGGKQIWREGDRWENAYFRGYWEPTATSVRRSPANPMQPSVSELRRRVNALGIAMRGVTCIHNDIFSILDEPIPSNSVVYVDPPYDGTTGYGFRFNLYEFLEKYFDMNSAPVFVSEGVALMTNAVRLKPSGAKGGISGTRDGRHQEWLTPFYNRPSLRAFSDEPFRARILDAVSNSGRSDSGKTVR